MLDDERGQLNVVRTVKALAPLVPVVGFLVAFAQNPYQVVARFISQYVIATIFGLGSLFIDSILQVFDWIVAAFVGARQLLVGAFGAVGIDVLGALRGVQDQIAAAVEMAGPAGPIVAVGLTALILFAVYRLAVALLGELPAGSSVVDLLGLR